MTVFQNLGGDTDIFTDSGTRAALLKSGTNIRGKRVDEYKISTSEFGIINTQDPFSSIFILKETDSILDMSWSILIQNPSGVHTDEIGQQKSFFIPSQSRVVVIERRANAENNYCFTILFQDTLAWVTLPTTTLFVPLKRPLLVRIISQSGCLVHSEKEVMSRPIGWVSPGSFLVISDKDYSETPFHFHTPFLKIHNDRGWIVFNPNSVEFVGHATPSLIKKYQDLPFPGLSSSPCVVVGENSSKCCICYEKSVDASFIHGDHAHTAACFQCAKKCESSKRGCPVCRLPIEKVVMNFLN